MKNSAGILLYRFSKEQLGLPQPSPQPQPEFLLVHPGGPFWAHKDDHAWSIPKGEIGPSALRQAQGKLSSGTGDAVVLENAEETARREMEEETGLKFTGELIPLPVLKTSGKIIHPFLGKGDFDPAEVKSNLFEMEWPPRSGRMSSFPEVDKAGWFDPATAKLKIHKGQVALIDMALKMIGSK